MMTSLPRLLTPRPPSQMTGMTSPTASGRLLRSTTLSTRVSGRPRESRTPHTRECGHPRRSPTLRTLTTPALDNLLITDDVEAAKAAADKIKTFQDGEKEKEEEDKAKEDK